MLIIIKIQHAKSRPNSFDHFQFKQLYQHWLNIDDNQDNFIIIDEKNR